MTSLEKKPALIIGTSAGTVIAYDQQGRRFWSGAYGSSADQSVLSVTAPPTPPNSSNPVALAILMAQKSGESEQTNIILLDSDGRRLEPSFPSGDAGGLSRLVDINRDGKSELLMAGFATLELVDPGIGARQFYEEWDYRLGAKPESVLVDDIDLDGEQEILVGTDDGKLHALENDGTVFWVIDLGSVISHLAIARTDVDSLPNIVAIHSGNPPGEDSGSETEGWIQVLRPDGRPIWSLSLPTSITTVLVGDINRSGPPELVIGTGDGQVIAYSLSGDEFWRTPIDASIEYLTLVNSTRGSEIIVGTGKGTISRLNNKGLVTSRLTSYSDKIKSLEQVARDETLIPDPVLMVGLDDGTLRSLSTRGNQNWLTTLGGVPTFTVPGNDSLFVSTDERELLRVNFDGDILWRLPDPGTITTLYWGDLDGDVKPDIAAGNRNGEVRIITDDGNNTWDLLDLASEVFHVSGLRRLPDLQAELVAITDNGIVQMFTSQANRPPLLINPEVEVDQGKYGISVTVIDAENDPVIVSLEIVDPSSGEWIEVDKRVASSGNDTLFWPVNPPDDAVDVPYRFSYDDGTHKGQVKPATGPPPIVGSSTLWNLLFGLAIAMVGIGGTAVYFRQSRSPSARVNRFLKQVRQQPELTLELLESEYNHTGGSPDFLLNLANKARRENNEVLASLADGLYLLGSQPESALPIITLALEMSADLKPKWLYLEEWDITYKTGHWLLTAPSVTELSLLLPQLELLVNSQKQANRPSEAIESLQPVLISLRDCGRVDLVEDRLVYLYEALELLRQLQYQSNYWPRHSENALAQAIADRWLGLVKAEIEELHGRAQLVVNLLTKQLVPKDKTIVAVEISNTGRSPAERVEVELQESPTYTVLSSNQFIPFLSPGRTRQVQFIIEPEVDDRFRILFNLTFDDRHGSGKKLAFADMVHLLPPVREFAPITNPYSPGMPLRSNSTVFYGREELFRFIGQNASTQSGQNVLILVGQRRTGKTSALLRLSHHLPETLLPVYIDCQSLGVTPGMPALLHDLAWSISDAMTENGYELPVPEQEHWQIDPAGYFQREFLVSARSLLPQGKVFLLVFDEFEAFQNLVNDKILPSTLFNYFRHLMQHEKGLSFIFAGTHRLEEMGSDYWSVLFNAALYRHISFLSRNAANRLIQDPIAPNIIYDDLALNKILRVTAGHPYFLQLVCYTLVNRANNDRTGYITISDVNSALSEMLRLGEVHFAYLWQRSTYPEKALLAAASRLMDYDTPFRPAEIAQYLDQYSIHLEPAEVTSGLNRLVEREILQEIAAEGTPLYEWRIELVGLWVAQNKSLSHLYESNDSMNLTKYA
jgi:outer membrane protein assembly factor BamB